MSIVSEVYARFADVSVTSIVNNNGTRDNETVFTIQIPLSAFISNFTMTINGVENEGRVMEKYQAEKLYDDARNRNETAGHVSQDLNPRKRRLDVDTFSVRTNVQARSSVLFVLQYQELLERRNGQYKQMINIQPNQIVPNLTMMCSYHEPQGFDTFQVQTPKGLSDSVNSNISNFVSIKTETPETRVVKFKPSVDLQTSFDPRLGIHGDVKYFYDVIHKESTVSGGLALYTTDGFIASYFSPADTYEVLPKAVVFVIDISGSMYGPKINQARDSLIDILRKLRPIDAFNIVLFDDSLTLFRESFIAATILNVNMAVEYAASKVVARGSTNLLKAINMVDSTSMIDDRGNIVIFLTDGLPSSGATTNPNEIRANIRNANYVTTGSKREYKAVIYSLAFGFDMDFGFLSALSEENGANARRIFEGVSAKNQLVYFYDELSDPYLSRVSFSIFNLDTRTEINKQVKVVTSRSEFPYFFGGSEIVMVGKMNAISTESWGICVNAVSSTGNTIIPIPSSLLDSLPSGISNEGRVDFIERIFAYKQIKYYLIMMDIARDESDAVKFKTLALNMSLEYNFVTPLTSMVVTQRLHDPSAEMDV
ncbi:LOW QUALITY PROTEIN: inter-alpha-trypsin inhibitor heavy chain H3-like [Dreissena polymorpha]|nr:LOW QUALITY PROTEIN: inter-alpha-trypsin inhibitor heavy chain H3-like [Dreissena polymorpha]